MDPLAGLPGADHFELLLAREELRRARTGEALAVSILDLDGMRAVNADHGTAACIELLRRCVESLIRTLRGVDDLARTGPDEFSVLLHATNAKAAACWAARFEDAFEGAAREHPAAPVTCSFGIADSTEEATLMEVAARARRRMEVIRNVRRQRRAREGGA